MVDYVVVNYIRNKFYFIFITVMVLPAFQQISNPLKLFPVTSKYLTTDTWVKFRNLCC